jgi:hypothetical protein
MLVSLIALTAAVVVVSPNSVSPCVVSWADEDRTLYAFVIVRLDRRDLVWINVTANPTAEWVARQITEAFPWG